ncbi:MAG TPA: hypothetical protein VHG93_27435 [Longimicrobium sp.]|nr:hypothetical protein [Longimicrobium sp.]
MKFMNLPNSPRPISTERVSINGNVCDADVSLRMLPEPAIVIRGEFATDISNYLTFNDDVATLTLMDRGLDIPILLTSRNFHSNQCAFTARPVERIILGNLDQEAVRVEFEVLNFPELRKRGPQSEGDADVELRAGEWVIYLRTKSDAGSSIRGLKESGGFASTICGTLCKADGGGFVYSAASEVLTGCYNFLSFSRGFWTAIVLPVAYDRAGSKVWEEWAMRDSTSWRGIESWLPSFGAETIMAEVFPGFWKYWNDPGWKESIELAIYWYVGSNKGESGAEGSIILTQTALELLSWMVLVKDRRVLDAAAFTPGKLSGADKIRLLLHTLDIPLPLPSGLVELDKVRRGRNWTDGPAAFVGLRNSMVHPGDHKIFITAPGRARADAMELGQWYIELALLRLFGYVGEYSSRVAERNQGVQRVPWER